MFPRSKAVAPLWAKCDVYFLQEVNQLLKCLCICSAWLDKNGGTSNDLYDLQSPTHRVDLLLWTLL